MLALTLRFNADIPPELKPILDISPTLARIMAARGLVSADQLDSSLGAMLPAQSLQGIEAAVNLLSNAIDAGKKILIVGDFDCDGATSTALMVRVLRDMGANVEFLVPDRFKYGYGLTPEIVQLGINQFAPDMIVTVDNGISSHAGVALAKSKGITVIITDHHLTTKAVPQADAVINPNQPGCQFLSKSLVGVGVAFYVLGNLAKVRRHAGKTTTQVSRYLDLVALGTVADVGVLDQNNRILVHHGLQAIREGRCCIGILALLEQAGKSAAKLSAQDLGFILGPRINAAGRMDNMRIGIDCLLTDQWGKAQQLAYQLDKLNQERRQVETQMRQQAQAVLQSGAIDSMDFSPTPTLTDQPANDTLNSRGIVLYEDTWHQGVIGIVAGRLKERYHRPAIVFAPADTNAISNTDAIKGSARSIEGIHIRDVIETIAEAHPHLISHFGGHAMAAGLTIERQHFDEFCQAFMTVLADLPAEVFAETLLTDGSLAASDYSLAFVEQLATVSIWGHGFVMPTFDDVFIIQDYRVLKERHLKLWLSHPHVPFTIEAIWFNSELEIDSLALIERGVSQIHILFELGRNDYNQQSTLQLRIKKAALITTDN